MNNRKKPLYRCLTHQFQATGLAIALLSALLVPGDVAAGGKPILAVMEIDSNSPRLTRSDLENGTALLRARIAVTGSFIVVDKSRQESELKVLYRELKKETYQDCYDRSCQVELGKALAADNLLRSTVTVLGGRCTLASEQVDLGAEASVGGGTANFDCTASGLLGAIEQVAAQVSAGRAGATAPALRYEEGPIRPVPPESGPGATSRVIVEFSSDPPGATVFEGQSLVCRQTPCSRELAPGTHRLSMQHPRHLTRVEDVVVAAGRKVDWKLTPDFAWLSVESQPPGLEVRIDGGAVGKTPLQRLEVSPGSHEVTVTSACHHDAGERVRIERGDARTVRVTPLPKQGTVDVSAADSQGNAVAAEVWAGRQKLGSTPGQFPLSVCATELEVRHGKLGVVKQSVTVPERSIARLTVAFPAGEALGIDWVDLPRGFYRKGSHSGRADERPLHGVTIQPFRMSRTEVTVAQYRACVEAKGCTPPNTKEHDAHCNWGHLDRESHPVNCVSWDQAKEFVAWFSKTHTPGTRLPSEAEWEFAARSGGWERVYPWGNEKPTCQFAVMDDGGNGCGQGRTWPVAQLPDGDTDQGLSDMAGNVWEWVEDCWHSSYTGAPSDGRAWTTGCTDDSSRVFRGGSWFGADPDFLRAANRNRRWSGHRDDTVGFRLVSPARGGS